MATESITVPTTTTKTNPCPCGCAPCEQTSCSLECLVQPNYFCGQLLTDADLRAGITWSQNKFRLERFRDGWGVVCGLEVRGDAKHPATIVVSPGYAVSCCGDDIILCSETPVDLTKYLREPPKPCEPARATDKEKEEERVRNQLGWVLDLYIQYAEEKSVPTATLGRAACGQAGDCEYSRIKETATLTPRHAPPGDPMDALRETADKWQRGYEECLRVLDWDVGDKTASDLQEWLRRVMAQSTLRQYMRAYEFLNAHDPVRWMEEHRLYPGELLFLIAQDCRNAYLACDCLRCEDDQGVPLARIWVRQAQERRSTRYYIDSIDAYPPFRRPQRRECLPAPLGWVNAGSAIWHRVDDAAEILAQHGLWLDVTASEPFFTEKNISMTPRDALGFLTGERGFGELMYQVGTRLQPLVYHSGDLDARVAGVRKVSLT